MSQSQRVEALEQLEQVTQRRRSRRGRTLNFVIAGVAWTLGAATLVFWDLGVGSAWRAEHREHHHHDVCSDRDGDVTLFTGVDEGQREVIYRAGAGAFSVAFWGMFALWIAYQIQPAWRADA
jgi:hypothetical protein